MACLKNIRKGLRGWTRVIEGKNRVLNEIPEEVAKYPILQEKERPEIFKYVKNQSEDPQQRSGLV